MVTLLKSVIAEDFLSKQQCIITIGAQHYSWPVSLHLPESVNSDFSSGRVCIAGGSMLKYLKKPISDSTEEPKPRQFHQDFPIIRLKP